MVILSSCYDCQSTHLQKCEKLKTHCNWFVSIFSKLVTLKGPGARAQSLESCKTFLKIFMTVLSISWQNFIA